MPEQAKIIAEALAGTLAFAWKNRDRATDQEVEQMLITIEAHGTPEEALVAKEALFHRRAERKAQLNLDQILGDDRPPKEDV